jgi:DNA polymerase II large subunit
METNNDGFDSKKALKNLKSFKKGFESVKSENNKIRYINYEQHENFVKMYMHASKDDIISSYAVRSGDTLYVDLESLLNCTEDEAYMIGLSAITSKLLSAKQSV